MVSSFHFHPLDLDLALTQHPGYVLATTDNRWCWNALYMYYEDLIWLWSGWEVSIITYSMLQVRIQDNLLLYHFTERPTISDSRWCWNVWYMYKEDLKWVWSVRMRCLKHNLQHDKWESKWPKVSVLLPPLCVRQSIYQCGVASLWPRAKVEGAETLYVCMTTTSYEYEVYEVPQS